MCRTANLHTQLVGAWLPGMGVGWGMMLVSRGVFLGEENRPKLDHGDALISQLCKFTENHEFYCF